MATVVSQAPGLWDCSACTFQNREPALVCAVCLIKRGSSIMSPRPDSPPLVVSPRRTSTDSKDLKNGVLSLLQANQFNKEKCSKFLSTMIRVFEGISSQPQNKNLRRFIPQKESFQKVFGSILGVKECLKSLGYSSQMENDKEMLVIETSNASLILQALKWGEKELESPDREEDALDAMFGGTLVSTSSTKSPSPSLPPSSSSPSTTTSSLTARALELLNTTKKPDTSAPMEVEQPPLPSPSAPIEVNSIAPVPMDTFSSGSSSFSNDSFTDPLPVQEPIIIEPLPTDDVGLAHALTREEKHKEDSRRMELMAKEQRDREAAIQLAKKFEEEEKSKIFEDEKFAAKLLALEKKEDEERKRRREEDEKADFELASRLMRELDDEKFAKDLEKLFSGEDKKRQDQFEKDFREAKKMQESEEKEFQKLLAEEKLRREPSDGPGYWVEPLPKGKKSRRVALAPGHELYIMVDEKFSKCGRKIKSLEYVQNPATWKNYVEAKKSTRIPEVWRFHGTPYQNVPGICDNGFLTSLDRSGGGTTIWSAEAASYSIGYSNKGPAPDGTLYMFLCRVLSTTATVSTVQNQSHMHPEFLISYK